MKYPIKYPPCGLPRWSSGNFLRPPADWPGQSKPSGHGQVMATQCPSGCVLDFFFFFPLKMVIFPWKMVIFHSYIDGNGMYIYIYICIWYWLVVDLPLWKILVSWVSWDDKIPNMRGRIKHVPNHQQKTITPWPRRKYCDYIVIIIITIGSHSWSFLILRPSDCTLKNHVLPHDF